MNTGTLWYKFLKSAIDLKVAKLKLATGLEPKYYKLGKPQYFNPNQHNHNFTEQSRQMYVKDITHCMWLMVK